MVIAIPKPPYRRPFMEIQCGICGVRLRFEPEDVKYTLVATYERRITCPQCFSINAVPDTRMWLTGAQS